MNRLLCRYVAASVTTTVTTHHPSLLLILCQVPLFSLSLLASASRFLILILACLFARDEQERIAFIAMTRRDLDSKQVRNWIT